MVRPSYERVGPHRLRQVFEVDLMADAGAGRHDAEVLERALAPLEEVVALAVALVFELDVLARASLGAPNSSTMTEWSMTRSTGTSGLIFSGSPPRMFMPSRMAARSTTAGTPVKSCISTRAGRKPISLLGLALVVQPVGHGLDVGLGDRAAIFVAQQVLQQHLHREGQLGDAGEAVLLGVGQRVVDVGLAVDGERLAAFEAVLGFGRNGAQGLSSKGGRL